METRIRVAGIWIADDAVLLETLVDREVWGLPGGQMEGDESLEQGVVREYREETGLRSLRTAGDRE